jgi:hypothetical protein
MSNGNGNGNGDVKKLVDLKHSFKSDVDTLVADLQSKYDHELEAGKKDLKDKYLEQVVDWFYSNGFNGHPPQPAVEPEPVPAVKEGDQSKQAGDTADNTAGNVTCPECRGVVIEGDKFCSQCSAPLLLPAPAAAVQETATTDNGPASAGRLNRRPPARPPADERLRNWGKTQRR